MSHQQCLPAASLHAAGWVPGGARGVYVRLDAEFVVRLAARCCGGAAVPLAEEAMRRLTLAKLCSIASLLVTGRSPGQDVDAAGWGTS